MTRNHARRRTIQALVVAAGVAAVGLAVPHADAAPAPAVPTAGEGLCLDLSPLNLPSICVGQLLNL